MRCVRSRLDQDSFSIYDTVNEDTIGNLCCIAFAPHVYTVSAAALSSSMGSCFRGRPEAYGKLSLPLAQQSALQRKGTVAITAQFHVQGTVANWYSGKTAQVYYAMDRDGA
jgi:hypothetical protein